MRKAVGLILFCYSLALSQNTPFSRGVNLTGWFQADNPKQIQFTKYTKKDLQNIKSLGADVIRLPIKLHSMTNGAPSYTPDPLFLKFLDSVVTWAEELDLHLILDNHTSDGSQKTDTNIAQILIPVWTKMAEHYKHRFTKLYYEILNEPQGITDAKWNQIQQQVVSAIRAVDTVHTIIVGPASWNSYNNLSAMPVYADTNLIYTFHFYDPFIFTHQGASWTDPSLVPLSGVPFPYNSQKMPTCPPALVGTWIQTALQYYHLDGTVQKIQERLNVAKNFRNARNVPIYCGELGVFIPNSSDTDRVYWYEVVRTYLEQNNIAWTIWDYQGGFGLFKKNSNEMFEHDLNISLLEALGFTVPPQTEYIRKPDSTNVELYTEYIGTRIENASYSPAGTLDFFYDVAPYNGNYCIHWKNALQYQHIAFDFKPNRDFSNLRNSGYVLVCRIKGDVPTASFDIRFVDSKKDAIDRPWRMRYKITNAIVTFNNEWQYLQIPLSNFTEHGAWDSNTWFNPQGLFEWTDIDRFEIVAEDMNLTNINLWFDDILIINPSNLVLDNQVVPSYFYLAQNYPNPFNPTTSISYQLPVSSYTLLKVYDLLGREVATLVDEIQSPGSYTVNWEASSLASGVYFYKLIANKFSITKRMMILK